VVDTASDVAKLGLTLPLLAAPLLGAAAGGTYRYATAPGYASPEEFRHIERMATLRKFTREARSRARKLKAKRDS
jgi:hypothetical protein